MTNKTTKMLTEKQMKIIRLLQDKYSNKIIKPDINDILGYALEYLLFMELDELKKFTRVEVEANKDLITNEDLKNKLNDKFRNNISFPTEVGDIIEVWNSVISDPNINITFVDSV